MKYKAYIVANEQQEREVLEKLEREECIWAAGGENPTKWVPSQHHVSDKEGRITFPLKIINDGGYIWQGRVSNEATDEEIVFDGRKENKMKIPENIYNMLVEWRDALELKTDYVTGFKLHMLNDEVHEWAADVTTLSDNHNRYIAILQWLNGEDVFEVDNPKKWAVRSKGTDNDGDYRYVSVFDSYFGITYADSGKDKLENATHFDTKEEAESWANAHQEVVEVVDV